MNMNIPIDKALVQVIGLGLVAGMRTFCAPAAISHLFSKHPRRKLNDTPLAFMQSPTASNVFKVLAVAELIGDKLPTAPDRTGAPGLLGRTASGALAGGTVFLANGRQPVVGAVVGAVSAIASTFGLFYLRKAVAKATRYPDPYIGAIEDTIAMGIATAVIKGA